MLLMRSATRLLSNVVQSATACSADKLPGTATDCKEAAQHHMCTLALKNTSCYGALLLLYGTAAAAAGPRHAV